MRFLIILRKTRTGYSADAPDLPGCIAAAGTIASTRKLMTSAMEMHLEGMQDHGEKVPRPRDHLELDLNDLEDGDFCTVVDVRLPRRRRKAESA